MSFDINCGIKKTTHTDTMCLLFDNLDRSRLFGGRVLPVTSFTPLPSYSSNAAQSNSKMHHSFV